MEEISQPLRKQFVIKTKLHDEQRAMVSRMIKKKNWLLVAKAGAGKSLCTISTFCYLYNNNKVDTLFVSMPKNAYDKAVWKEELRKHSNIPFIDIETLASKTGLNLSKIKQVVSQYPVILSKHTHVHVYSDLIKLIMSSTRCSLTIDELHKLKNSQSRLTIAARLAFNRAYVRSGLTACLLDDEYVSTSEGLKKAKDLKEGDKVLVQGFEKRVTDFIDNGIRDCYQIETKSGFSLKCTYNHPFLVNNKFIFAKDLKEGDKVHISFEQDNNASLLKVTIPKSYRSFYKVDELRLDSNIGSLLGWLTGDGYCESSSHRMGWMFSESDMCLSDKFRDILKSINLNPCDQYRTKFNDKREDIDSDKLKPILTIRVNCKQLSQFLKANGYSEAKYKRVPEFIMRSSKECRASYIKYLFGADGNFRFVRVYSKAEKRYKVIRTISMSSASKSLLRDVQLMLTTFGIRSRIHFQEKVEGRKRSSDKYTLRVYNNYLVRFVELIGVAENKLCCIDNKYLYHSDSEIEDSFVDEVESVKFIGKRHTIGHTIEDGLYVTSGIITHNTPLSKDMKDCYNLINFIKPWFLGTFDNFKQEFCVVKQKVIGRTFTGALRKVDEIVGVISEQALQQRLYPIVISGSSHHELNFHYLNYEMDSFETSIYRRLATGLFTASDDETPEDWFHRVITQEQKPIDYSIKEVSRHSSRFLYLQFAADGLIQEDGTIGNRLGTKSKLILSCLKSIFQKGLSTVLFCEYYAQLDFMKKCLKRFFPNVRVLEASGKVALKEGSISEAAVKQKPHCILLSKAGSESSSFYFINNVVFFSIPTIPSAFIQTVGRINRVNTLFPGDLHVWIPQSDNVDKYKMLLVSKKTALSESVTNRESNVPDDFKEMAKGIEDMKLLKKYLLWHQDESDKLTL